MYSKDSRSVKQKFEPMNHVEIKKATTILKSLLDTINRELRSYLSHVASSKGITQGRRDTFIEVFKAQMSSVGYTSLNENAVPKEWLCKETKVGHIFQAQKDDAFN